MNPPVDIDNLDMLKELIGDDLKEILQAYLDTAPESIMKLEQATQSGDANAVRMHAHSLKGSSANIGAHDLSASCSQLEQMGKNNQVDQAAINLAATINQENSVVSEFLQSYMQKM